MKPYVRPQKRPIKRLEDIPSDIDKVISCSCDAKGVTYNRKADPIKKTRKEGFSLIELLIVITVIGIIASIDTGYSPRSL